MNEKWLNDIQCKMQSYEVNPPGETWDKIASAIDVEKRSNIRRKRKVLLWRSLAAIGAVAAVVCAVIFIGNEDISTNVTSGLRQPVLQAEVKNLPVADTTSNVKETISSTIMAHNVPQIRKTDSVDNAIDNNGGEVVPVQSANPNQPSDSSETKTDYKLEELLDYEPKSEYGYGKEFELKHTASKNSLSAAIFASNLMGGNLMDVGYGELMSGKVLSQVPAANEVWVQSPLTTILMNNFYNEPVTKKEHRLPVRIGATVRYRFNERMGLESGVTYTYLSSHLTAGSENDRYETEQNLQFLGVPVNFNYVLWQNRQWEVYASAGGMAEICVKGDAKTDYVVDDKLDSSEKYDARMRQLQFSATATAGVQFNITSNFGLYAEPGIIYYFDNGSDIETIYKDKPFNFNMKVGLRLSLKK